MQSKSPIHTPAGLKEHLFATSTASEVQLEQNLRRHSQKAKAERERDRARATVITLQNYQHFAHIDYRTVTA